ncbi:unnamed protein product [Didymodactylos carnosus]|uniref:non-specific serine/threonine protein kinase n=1 Tax=Didymodactylos carnosus TaxID=1234261 RepID=A0A814D180_9BILA|nr:unnamed protein product [Didymodactylos carnosus]CAF1132913.1 unnamed protein product [Didymodactylos carnosus]CAF3725263.1 unnamed protein product [Didymodactylos carnosus]CAF3918202.1 unnamed protein product [Didymodactylos carnosus]
MTTLEHAFNAKDMNSLVIKIIRGQPPQTSKKYSAQLATIIKAMLSKDPDDRPTAKKLLQNTYIKQHIVQLLEKTKIRCQNQNQASHPVIVNSSSSSSRPTSAISSSSPPRSRVNSSNERLSIPPLPVTSNSPSSKNRQNGNSVNILPSPPSQIQTPRVSSAKSIDDASGLPPSSSNDVRKLSEARTRRTQQRNAPNNIPVSQQQVDDEVDRRFIEKVRQNDTLNRRRRDHTQLNDHIKQEKIQNHLRNSEQLHSDRSQESDPEYAPVIHDQILHKSSSSSTSSGKAYNDNGYRRQSEAGHYMSNGEENNRFSYNIDDSISQMDSSFDSNQKDLIFYCFLKGTRPNKNARMRRRKKLHGSSDVHSSHSASSSPIAGLLSNDNEPIDNNHNDDVNFYLDNDRHRSYPATSMDAYIDQKNHYSPSKSEKFMHHSADISSNSVATRNSHTNEKHYSKSGPLKVFENNSEDNKPLSRSTSKESVNTEVEKKKEGEKDMNDLLFMLTSTLKLPASVSGINRSESIDDNELTHSSSTSDRTIVDEDEREVKYSSVTKRSSLLPPDEILQADRTINPLGGTSKVSQRYNSLRQDCLREISSSRLRRALDIIDRVAEAELTEEMINILGNELYNKYSARIFTLKFYEDTLHCH